jgi:uncharacterized membrane protein YjjB (DUF3815 family)
MFRRIVALALWTYFAWYLGAMIATFTGGPSALGPALATFTAAICVTGWVRSNRRRAMAPAGLEPSISR